MNALQLMRLRLETLPIADLLYEATVEAQPVIEDMNADQLLQGKRADDTEITPKYRNPLYAQAKQYMNSKPKPGTPDLKNTGAFHAGIRAQVTREDIELMATEEKSEMLQAKYGDAIIGLSPASIAELQYGHLGPNLQFSILNYLQSWLQNA